MIKWFIANRLKFLIGLLIVTVILIVVTLQFPINQLPSEGEVQSFIKEKGINPILISDVGNSYTAIIFYDGKSNEKNEFIVYKNRINVLKAKLFAFYDSGRTNKVDVEYWGIQPYGYNLIGYVGIEIMNENIASEAKTVKVVLDNNIGETASFEGSNILLIPATRMFFWEKPVLETIEIYDKNGDVIHGFYSNSVINE